MLRAGMIEPVIEYDDFREFVTLGPNEKGRVLVLLLEHEAELPDSRLITLTRWSPEDLERLSRFRHQGAKTSWCVSRFLFRQVMRNCYGHNLSEIPIAHGRHGKPYLPRSSVQFNWSHAAGCVALAISSELEIGCDVEDSTRGALVDDNIPDWIFSISEREWINRAESVELRKQRMLSLFVQKEAQLKASGEGLSDSVKNMAGITQDPPFRYHGVCCFCHGANRRFMIAV